jgi:hypothetical protein
MGYRLWAMGNKRMGDGNKKQAMGYRLWGIKE